MEALERTMAGGAPFAITGVVYQEILEGADSPESHERLRITSAPSAFSTRWTP
ncbi:hypothetical protein [Thiohalorhabdus methylotrophus]|uniref:Uncharacterized protein n=1 Tax=Thiohalorhabdus methylotrophus TaxID=3242694 RepID=A0ABV4TWR9_9GAMM